MMGILDELKVFIKSIFSGVVLVIVLSFIFFILPLHHSITSQVFQQLEHEFLPPTVHLIVTNPLSAFIAEMEVSLLLAFIILFPFFIYKIITYLSPALHAHERKLILWSVVPTSVLFFAGACFAYLFVIPASFKILYPYALSIDATPFFSIEEFMSSVFGLLITTGLIFLLPVGMVLLSYMRIVSHEFWRNKTRHALLVFLIFTAIITPDGTGITMMILFLPLAVLYVVGLLLTAKWRKRKMS